MEQKIQKQFIAVRAVIVKDDKVLIIRESEVYRAGGIYDFPGGKIKIGESMTEAVIRETKEEVGIEVKVGEAFFVADGRPIVKGEQIQVIAIFFLCELLDTVIKLGKDHDMYEWIPISDYSKFPLIKENQDALKVLILNK